jgi:predicted HD superfamily hydrolase involved in NAD metabolism
MIEMLPSPIPAFAGSDVSWWRQRVELLLKPDRFAHSMRVAELAREIALAAKLDGERAYFAGVVHDIARDLPSEQLLALAPPENEIDRGHALAVHGRAGRVLLEQAGLHDEVVLEAVEDHTTGPRGGNLVAVALYVADVSEPGRGVNHHIRELAYSDLETAFALALARKVEYLQGRGIKVHPRTLLAYQNLDLERLARLDDLVLAQDVASRAAAAAAKAQRQANGAGSNGAGSNGAGSNGAGSNGAGSNGAGSNGAGSNGTGSNGVHIGHVTSLGGKNH